MMWKATRSVADARLENELTVTLGPEQQTTLDLGFGDVTREVRVGPEAWNDHAGLPTAPRIVVGGPGTGKTQFLCESIASAIEAGDVEPSEVLAVTFSRSGVDDLRTRLRSRVGTAAQRLTIATFHGLAMRLIEAHASDLGWAVAPTFLTSVEQERLVAELMANEDEAAWPSMFRGLLTTPAMADEVTNFILRAGEQNLSPGEVAALDRDQWRALPSFLDRYHATLRQRNRIDYATALTEALRLIRLRPEVASPYRLVVADEYQDTSKVQADLVLELAASDSHLVVAADPYQSIYSFRGTNINNVYDFPDEARAATGATAERLILTTSFRVPWEILDAAVAVTARQLPGGAGKVNSTRTSGAVSCHEFSSAGAEAEWIASDIERVHLVEGVPLRRIAVFVRNQGDFLEDLARALERRGLPHSHADDRLADEPIVRFVHDIVRVCARGDDAAASLRRVLLGPYMGVAHGRVSQLPPEDTTWAPFVRELGHEFGPLATLIDSPAWCTDRNAARGLWHLWTKLPQLHSVATDSAYARDATAWASFAQVLDRQAARNPTTTLADYVEDAGRFDFEADPLFTVSTHDGVTLSTLHRAKGTEFDVVYIADAVEGHLPDLRARESLLGTRHLNPNLPTKTADYVSFRLDEERRLAYTAMTRSTSRVVWTATVARDHGEGGAPSRFMRLVAATSPAPTSDRPLTKRAYLAALRRTASDPERGAVERIAAVAALVSEAEGNPLDRYGVRPHGIDHGIAPDELRLSPSRANGYVQCGYRFAVERFLLSHTDDSVYMTFGNIIHTVLEVTERAAMESGRRGTVGEALANLDLVWADSDMPDDAVGRAWLERARRMLRDTYEGWPSAATPIELEVDLPITFEGVPWTGRADRIERIDGGIRVVDYKTGSLATQSEAAESIQLGYYALAAAQHGALAGHGPVTEASFWFLKQRNKGGIATRDFDMGNLDMVKDAMRTVADGIRTESFVPKPGSHCRSCDAYSVCPAQSVGVEAFSQ